MNRNFQGNFYTQIIGQSKYQTTQKQKDANKKKTEQDMAGIYSFGVRFYYWPWFKNRHTGIGYYNDTH